MSTRATAFRDEADDEDADVHPWVGKARAIDEAFGGVDLSADALAKFVRIVKVATADSTPGAPGRKRGGRADRVGRRVVR